MAILRGQRLRLSWKSHRIQNDTTGKSYLNFGRFKLMDYLHYHYNNYVELITECKETPPLSFARWLLES